MSSKLPGHSSVPRVAHLNPREDEHTFRILAETTECAIFVWRETLLYVNPAMCRITGYTAGEMLIPAAWEGIIHPDDRERVRESGRARLRGESVPRQYEFRIINKAGEERWIDFTASPVRYRGKSAVLGTAYDITDRKRAEAALQFEKERAQVTLESIGDGVITTDVDSRIEYMNAVAETLTGWTRQEAASLASDIVVRLRDSISQDKAPDPVRRCLVGRRSWQSTDQLILTNRDDSQEYAIEITSAPIRNADGTIIGCVLVLRDVTTLRNLTQEITWQARHDPLTGLINRAEFEVRLAQALDSALSGHIQHALCYLDLDQFKFVNDTCGHTAGDELLKQLTGHLQERIRISDTLARLGGDEFGVLLEHCSLEDASETAEVLRQVVSKFRFSWQDKVFEIGVSIGVVPITAESGSLVDVLSAADSACYVAKDHGRNRIHVWQPEDQALIQRRGEIQWVHRVHQALDDDRFQLFLQKASPLDDSVKKRYGEILVRMISEDGETISPMAFIPAAERYQLMPALDRWVLNAAMQALASQHPMLADVGVCAINLSGQSLCDDHFLHSVVELLDRTGVDPARVCFEITETAAIANLSRATRFISLLKGMGCKFALDDFGSGLSSFMHLKHLHVDYLKIEGSFVRDMGNDPIDAAMVDSINRIGHIMGLQTIAESVEEESIQSLLRGMGVNYAQGSLIEKPLPFTASPISLSRVLQSTTPA